MIAQNLIITGFRRGKVRHWALVILALIGCAVAQQTNIQQSSIAIPHIIRYSGSVPLSVPSGQTELKITFRIYSVARGSRALWQETQTVTAESGKISALIGSATVNGIPDYWFAQNLARWLEVQVGDEPPSARIALAAVPYALKAANAETLGGRPLSAFVLRDQPISFTKQGVTSLDTTSYATLGANSFVGDQGVNGSVNVTGYVNTALATVSSPLIVNQLLWVNSTATTGGVISVKAQNASVTGTGIMGIVTSTTGNTVGVIGRSDSVVGNGVYGVTTSPTGSAEAISGTAMATQGHGVGGYAVAAAGTSVGVFGKSYSSQGTGVQGESSPTSAGYTTYGVVGSAHGTAGIAIYGVADSQNGNTIGVFGSAISATGISGMFVSGGGGNILLGQNQATKVFRVDATGKVYGNGGFQSNGADFAESVAVRGERSGYEPGDVLAVDEDSDRRVKLVTEAYSVHVAGVYSTKPGTLSTPHPMDSAALEDEVPMAVIGIVPCKVTTANGAIHRGDLLVSSDVAGYAMKGTNRLRMPGAILGKALQELPAGRGVIEILVTLE